MTDRSPYVLLPEAVPLVLGWLTPERGDPNGPLKSQARLLIESQQETIRRLATRVEAAYREGHRDGGHRLFIEAAWARSNTKQALDAAVKEKG